MVQIESICGQQKKVAEKMKIVLSGVENIVGKGKSAGCHHFLLLPQFFQKASFTEVLEVGIVWQRVKSLTDYQTTKF